MATQIVPTHVYDIMHPKSELLYPATDAINKLLRVVGAEVCSFHRNHQVAYRLVERARDLYDAINARIYLVDINDSWEDYEIYTQAIDPLEEVLLHIILVAFDERKLDHISTDSWAEYVRVTGQWRENRLAIRDCLRNMKTKPQFQALTDTLIDDEENLLNAYTLDDLSYLDYLLRVIGENIQQTAEPKVKGYIEKVTNGLSKAGDLQRKSSGKHKREVEELAVIIIQCAQIVAGVVTMMVNAAVPVDIRDRLMKDTSFWVPLATALSQTIAALEAAGQDAGTGRSSPANGPTEYNQINDGTKAQDSADNCARLYEQSADELAACFKTMEIQYDVDHREKLKQAQNKDSVRVTEVNEKLNQYERPATVEVAVDVYENNQNGKKVKALLFVSIPSTAHLEYVKYLVASQLEDRELAQTGHFERASGSADPPTFLYLDSEVKCSINDRGAVVFIVHRPGRKGSN
ncbi:unnamed protein product [Rhizoctonia solani]|uniref:Uncharacterized protein n=1 Tax=Rhizoctonia solani TaxID=456999 RepID=A0A8H2X9M9_9AGAM|nr:unnamed protein product [Rhizoctonia solani]